MFKFLCVMVIPVFIFIYTLSFTRWLSRKRHIAAATSAAVLAVTSLFVSGAALWRILN